MCCGNLTREVVGTERQQRQDVLYYVMRESGVEYRLRSDGQGRVLVLDPQTGTEKQWYAFGTREGEEYETAINRCNPSAQVVSRAATYHGPGGDISNALRIAYTSTCNFAGLQEETSRPASVCCSASRTLAPNNSICFRPVSTVPVSLSGKPWLSK